MDIQVTASQAKSIRRRIVQSIHAAQSGHAGPSLSVVEILLSIIGNDSLRNDYLLLSKGHAAPALYAVMAEFGLIPVEELATLRRFGSRLQGHPTEHYLPNVDVTTGSVGQALSVGLGLCLGQRLNADDRRVFVVLGDGELQEGQVWEAAMAASSFRSGKLTCIIDRNKFQSDGPTESIIKLGNLSQKWHAFGWETIEVDGHSLYEISEAIEASDVDRGIPTVIIADTVKGKGVSFMENSIKWHHHPISDSELETALSDINKT